MLASHAEYDNAIRAERARMAMIRKAKLGGTPYQPPPGYRIEHTQIDGRQLSTVVADPEQAALMTAAFRRYSGGDLSLVTLADEMDELGLRTRYGTKVKANQFHKLLRSHYYLGAVPFAGEVYENGNHPALIDRATFDRVQAVMRAHAAAGEKRRMHNRYLKGSVFCGCCGKRLVFNLATGNGGNYAYLFCVGRRTDCPSRHLRVDHIEQAVLEHYATVQLSSAAAEKVRRAVWSYGQALRENHDSQLQRINRRLAAIQKKRDKLFDAYAADAMNLQQFKRKQKQLDQEQADINDLAAIATGTFQDIERLTELALAIATNAQSAYRSADHLERRMMNRAIFAQLLVSEDGVQDATLATPYADLLDEDFPKDLAPHGGRQGPENGQPRQPLAAGGWNEALMARPRGFEPLTIGSVAPQIPASPGSDRL